MTLRRAGGKNRAAPPKESPSRPLPTPETNARPFVRLKPNEDRRVRRGHLWIFSNEIDQAAEGLEPGAEVEFLTSRDERLGVGFYNPRSLIAGRLLGRRETAFDTSFITARLQNALALRRRFFTEDAFRWVHGESDDLPGLVIDRYGDVCVIESFAAGVDRLLPAILDAVKTFGPWRALVLRNDASARRLEHLPNAIVRFPPFLATVIGSPSDVSHFATISDEPVKPADGAVTAFAPESAQSIFAIMKSLSS
jgi:hypothetical protein